jgi:hypothetical protein
MALIWRIILPIGLTARMAPLPKYALLGVNLGRSIPALISVTLATCWATTSMGLLLVSVVKSRRQQ